MDSYKPINGCKRCSGMMYEDYLPRRDLIGGIYVMMCFQCGGVADELYDANRSLGADEQRREMFTNG